VVGYDVEVVTFAAMNNCVLNLDMSIIKKNFFLFN